MKKIVFKPLWILFILAALIIAGIISLFVSDSTIPNDHQGEIKYLIGVSQPNLIEPWQIETNLQIRNEASKYSDTRIIFANAASSTEKQIRDIQMMLSGGIDLLIVSPNDEKALDGVLSKVYKKIPVIVLDKEIKSDNFTLFIGVDNYQIGFEAGNIIKSIVGSGSGHIIQIGGKEESDTTRERIDGFYDSIKDDMNLSLEKTIYADWNRDQAEDELKVLFPQYPDVNIIFAHDDAMAYGAYVAAKKMRISNIKIIGVGGLDGITGGKALVDSGVLTATIANTVAGSESIEYAMNILRSEIKIINKKIILKSDIIR